MKEHPILFSGEMVRAILEGRKTQTRRIVKFPIIDRNGTGCEIAGNEINSCLRQGLELCPYGRATAKDRLWVKETHNAERGQSVIYAATCDSETRYANNWYDRGFKWKPSIFMRREHSRTILEIESVRVERLKDISEEDSVLEGCSYCAPVGDSPEHQTAKQAYLSLWESINGKGSWDLNPWVWVINFKKL